MENATVADSRPRCKAAKFCQDSVLFRRPPHACRHSDKISPPWAKLATMIPLSWAHQTCPPLQANKELWEPTWPRNWLGQIVPRAVKPFRRSCRVVLWILWLLNAQVMVSAAKPWVKMCIPLTAAISGATCLSSKSQQLQ